MSNFKKFITNGGGIKVMLWLIFLCVAFLLKVGWRVAKFDSRLEGVEKAVVAREDILKSIPQIQTDVAVIKSDVDWIKRELKRR